MRSFNINIQNEPIKYNAFPHNLSSRSRESYAEDYFFPAGSISSHEINTDRKNYEEIPNKDPFELYEKKSESPSNFIEYLEYLPSPEKKIDLPKPHSVSLCTSPDCLDPEPSKFSQTQVLVPSKLFENDNRKFSQSNADSINNEFKFKSLCETYEKQNRILRDEVQKCTKEMKRMMKYQEQQKVNFIRTNEEAGKTKVFLKMILQSVGEILEEKFENPDDEHSFNIIASQLQLLQSRIARKQSLYVKTKDHLESALQENKEIKAHISEISQTNMQLLEKLENKKQKIRDLKKALGKNSERYTEESEYRVSSSAVSKSSTPLSEETLQTKHRTKTLRTLSAKEPLIGDIGGYREALRDLKDLSERAHSKISETKKKLKNIPTGKSALKFIGFSDASLMRTPAFIKYYRN